MKEIPLTKGFTAFVDDADFESVSAFNWCYSDGYAVRSVGGRMIRMHLFLLPGVKSADHRDGDGCNNQRYNLRPATKTQNGRGFQKKSSRASSTFRGVCWDAQHRKWRAQIKLPDRNLCLGVFASENDAARAYDTAARKHYGDFATPNFV